MDEKIIIDNRNYIFIKGATKVLSVTATQAVVEVDNSCLVISGNNLEVTKLDLEGRSVELSGEIQNLKYTRKQEKIGLFKRLFK